MTLRPPSALRLRSTRDILYIFLCDVVIFESSKGRTKSIHADSLIQKYASTVRVRTYAPDVTERVAYERTQTDGATVATTVKTSPIYGT